MKIGVIGCGNMASAILQGVLNSGLANAADIVAADPFEAARKKAEEKYAIKTTAANAEAVDGADLVLLSVKPQVFPKVAPGLSECLSSGQVVLSIMAGKSLAELTAGLGEEQPIVRAMPNMPALVGEGITGYCPNAKVTDRQLALAVSVIKAFSEAEAVPETLMSVVTSVSGSSPAFVFMFIEALADGAVAEGMPRAQALHFAAQTVLGSAKAVLSTGKHPGELKDMVCSPAGTTIAGVAALEKRAFRSAVIEAVQAAAKRAREL